MRSFLFFFCLLTLMACQKEAIQHDKDIQLIKDYIATNNSAAIEEPMSNYFYDIYFESGDSIAAIRDRALVIEVNYTAHLLDGTLIHDTGNISEKIELDNAIFGWQLAIPRMDINDKMQLFLPSRLAYGEEGNGSIPPNAVVLFDIELVDVAPRF